MRIHRLHHYSPRTSSLVLKIKNCVSFPCHITISMILDLLYTGNILTWPFSSTWRIQMGQIQAMEKRIRIQLWEKSYSREILHFILSLHPFFLLSLNTLSNPQALPYLIEKLIVSLIRDLLWWRIEVVEVQLEGT